MATAYAVRGVLDSSIFDSRQLFARNTVFMNIFCAARVLFQISRLAFACSVSFFLHNSMPLLPHEEALLSILLTQVLWWCLGFAIKMASQRRGSQSWKCSTAGAQAASLR